MARRRGRGTWQGAGRWAASPEHRHPQAPDHSTNGPSGNTPKRHRPVPRVQKVQDLRLMSLRQGALLSQKRVGGSLGSGGIALQGGDDRVGGPSEWQQQHNKGSAATRLTSMSTSGARPELFGLVRAHFLGGAPPGEMQRRHPAVVPWQYAQGDRGAVRGLGGGGGMGDPPPPAIPFTGREGRRRRAADRDTRFASATGRRATRRCRGGRLAEGAAARRRSPQSPWRGRRTPRARRMPLPRRPSTPARRREGRSWASAPGPGPAWRRSAPGPGRGRRPPPPARGSGRGRGRT